MERTSLFEDDLTEQRSQTPVQREEAEHTIALDPDAEDADDDEDAAEEEEEDEDLDD